MPIINGEHCYYTFLAKQKGQSQAERAYSYWLDLSETFIENGLSERLPWPCVDAMEQTWHCLVDGLANGENSLDELRGFAQAFTAAAGFNLQQSCWAQDAFEFIE